MVNFDLTHRSFRSSFEEFGSESGVLVGNNGVRKSKEFVDMIE